MFCLHSVEYVLCSLLSAMYCKLFLGKCFCLHLHISCFARYADCIWLFRQHVSLSIYNVNRKYFDSLLYYSPHVRCCVQYMCRDLKNNSYAIAFPNENHTPFGFKSDNFFQSDLYYDYNCIRLFWRLTMRNNKPEPESEPVHACHFLHMQMFDCKD